MPSQSAEIIDLKAYRQRRSEQSWSQRGSATPAASADGSYLPMTMMPTAFVVFWPTWVFAPAMPFGSVTGGQAAT